MSKNKVQQEEITVEFIKEVLKLKPEDMEMTRLMLRSVAKSEMFRSFIDKVFALVKETLPLGIEMKKEGVQ